MVTISSMPAVAEEVQRVPQILGPVADADDVSDLAAELEEPLGDPRAVAVRDLPGQDLGPGDDDPAPGGSCRLTCAHGQLGPA